MHRDSSDTRGDIYTSSNYYRQPQSSGRASEEYYREAASPRPQDSWYSGDYHEAFASSYKYQPSESDSQQDSHRDTYTKHSEYGADTAPNHWDSWDSKRFSR